MSEGKAGEEIILIRRKAIIIFEVARITARMHSKDYFEETDAIMDLAKMIG